MKAFYSITIASLLATVSVPLSCAGAADVPVKGGTVAVTKQQCQALATYRPAAGVNYQPGVDVHGKPVAPADLPGSAGAGTYNLPKTVEFNLQVNPLSTVQPGAATGQFANTALPVGHVSVDTQTGAVSLNGQPIGDNQQRALADLCTKAGY